MWMVFGNAHALETRHISPFPPAVAGQFVYKRRVHSPGDNEMASYDAHVYACSRQRPFMCSNDRSKKMTPGRFPAMPNASQELMFYKAYI